jgi:hypothetical protein
LAQVPEETVVKKQPFLQLSRFAVSNLDNMKFVTELMEGLGTFSFGRCAFWGVILD